MPRQRDVASALLSSSERSVRVASKTCNDKWLSSSTVHCYSSDVRGRGYGRRCLRRICDCNRHLTAIKVHRHKHHSTQPTVHNSKESTFPRASHLYPHDTILAKQQSPRHPLKGSAEVIAETQQRTEMARIKPLPPKSRQTPETGYPDPRTGRRKEHRHLIKQTTIQTTPAHKSPHRSMTDIRSIKIHQQTLHPPHTPSEK